MGYLFLGKSLIYLDPPFFTQKVQKLRTRDRTREFVFRDLWSSHSEYAEFLYVRLNEFRRVLSAVGSLFFHCDRNASHIARALLDEVFGEEMFRAEIIWHYRRWSNSQRTLLPAHQTIYFYSKTENYKFNTSYQDYSLTTNVDQILQKRTRDEFGKSIYARDELGTIISNGHKNGVPLSDVWTIPYLNPKAKERTGYPTQKPILLLERIIELCTEEGDWVLDPFCGSGTTLVAARLLGRNSMGIDTSEDAVAIARHRSVDGVKTESALLSKGLASYNTADAEVSALLAGLESVPVQRNKGIDALLKMPLGGRPVPIRVQRRGESLSVAARALYQASQSKHALVMILVATDRYGHEGEQLPSGITVVDAPAVSIQQVISKLKEQLG